MKIFLLFLFVANLIAQDDYSLRVAFGKASGSDLGDIISGDMSTHQYDMSVTALDGGYLLKERAFTLPIDIYAKGSLAYFDESKAPLPREDIYEATLYLKAYWNLDFLDNRVRVGFGEGISYTSSILYVEYQEASQKSDNNSYILNYIDISLDVDFGKIIRYKPLYGSYIGWALKHRSGIYGLINSVKKGGSNYNTIYIEKNF